MEAFYLRLYITCIFGAEIYKCYGNLFYYQCYCLGSINGSFFKGNFYIDLKKNKLYYE